MKLALMLAVCAALAPAQARKNKPQAASIETLVVDLGSRDGRKRNRAYQELRRRRDLEAIPLLVKYLASYPVYSQSYGMYLLDMYPRAESDRALRKMLVSTSPFLRLAAAATLHRRGDSGAVKHIVRAIRAGGNDANALTQMLSRITGIEDADIEAAVRDLVAPGANASVVNAALYHCLRNNDTAAVANAKDLLASPAAKGDTRVYCAAFLAAMGQDDASDELVAALGDRNGLSRVQRFLNEAPRLPAAVIDAIVTKLEDRRNVGEVRNALRILEKQAPSKILAPLKELLLDKNDQLSKLALETLGRISGSIEKKTLRELVASGNDEIALTAADTLRKMDDMSGIDRVLEIARQSGNKRREAVAILGKFRSQRVVEPLIDALGDKDLQVRRSAESGLLQVLRNLLPYRRIDLKLAGYESSGNDAGRTAAIAQIRTWWTTVKK